MAAGYAQKKTATDHPATVQKQHKQIIRKSEAIPVYVGVLKPEGGFKLTPKPFGPTIATGLYSWLWPSFGLQAGWQDINIQSHLFFGDETLVAFSFLFLSFTPDLFSYSRFDPPFSSPTKFHAVKQSIEFIR